jgi:hypothetical protein
MGMSGWRCLFAAVALAAGSASKTAAQQRDTSLRPAVRPPTAAQRAALRADSLRPPLSPRRSFLYALAVPGLPQSIFGRHRVAAGVMAVETISLLMIRESSGDVREARRAAIDTIVVSYVDANGQRLPSPISRPGTFTSNDVRTRRTHVEDWVALLIANHLFAASDAFVAAHLWDVPAQIGVRPIAGGAAVTAQLRW